MWYNYQVQIIPRRLVARAVRFLYHIIPLNISKKQKIKTAVFRWFGFALRSSSAYQRWKKYEEIREAVRSIGSRASKAKKTRDSEVSKKKNADLSIADGRWEWMDYSTVSERIREVKRSRRESCSPDQIKIIDIGGEALEKAASRIELPLPGEHPDVSIIISVFNNIKYTLECLLSISQKTGEQVSYEVIIANDASTDETVKVLDPVKNVKVINNEKNLGFLRNCNGALQFVNGRYVVFLNNDLQVTQGWLTAFLNTFKQHDRVGAVGPLILHPRGPTQEAGASIRPDGTSDMIGHGENPNQNRFKYARRVDYCSGACLMLPAELLRRLGGFSDEYSPNYCEDSDLCLRVQQAGYCVYFEPDSVMIHHLSATIASKNSDLKLSCIARNLVTFSRKWQSRINDINNVRCIAFYLPQFHAIPENDKWWGRGFTDWTKVTTAQPNFIGHYQPRVPADLGYYDLNVQEVLEKQAALARRYGIEGFCFYYYWFGGKRLLEIPIERMLKEGCPDIPFCLCWANENWTRRWDGKDDDILIGQAHSESDDYAVIKDLMRYFRDKRYIRIDGRPLILVYRVPQFPDFATTSQRWREACRSEGMGEIYIAMVESFDFMGREAHPNEFGCDAAVEFPPTGMAEMRPPKGEVINPNFQGQVADYRDLSVWYATREMPAYKRFRGVMPGWDNTARQQNIGFCFEYSTPGAFQAWVEEVVRQTRQQFYGDEQIIFINAWNEWAEGAYLEPDNRFGHTYLEAILNGIESNKLVRLECYALGGEQY